MRSWIWPAAVGAIFLLAWEALVRLGDVPVFVLPPPSAVAASLATDLGSLAGSLLLTLEVTGIALALAAASGVALAVLFAHSRPAARAFMPYAVALQVTPVVSIAPLIVIWVGLAHVERALVILAWIVAFFPILSNTTLGLRSTDPNLRALFRLYGASRWQMLVRLELPSALPYLLAGLKISGGLALIGAVVAEFVAGSGAGTGIAWRIVESGNRLNIARMFAALLLLSLAGIVIFAALSALERLLLGRWHESARRREP